MRHLQELSAKYRDQGLVVLGVNDSDTTQIARDLLERNGVDFPNILDTSPEAVQAMQKYEILGNNTVPMTCIIDRQGKVVDSWYGKHEEKKKAAKGMKILEKEIKRLDRYISLLSKIRLP